MPQKKEFAHSRGAAIVLSPAWSEAECREQNGLKHNESRRDDCMSPSPDKVPRRPSYAGSQQSLPVSGLYLENWLQRCARCRVSPPRDVRPQTQSTERTNGRDVRSIPNSSPKLSWR